MPELPDVEVFRSLLERSGLDRRIERVEISAPEMLDGVSVRELRSNLKGASLVETRRHGKYLFGRTDRDGWLLLHFGMTGDLEFAEDRIAADHVRMRVDFADGSHLAFRDVRTFGRIGLVDDVDAFIRERRLGPDPMRPGFGIARLRQVFAGRRTPVKSALMDQQSIAGIGNVYADEILFQARIHPETPAGSLDDTGLRRILRVIRRVLEAAIAADADPDRVPRSWLLPHRHAGARCPRCGTELRRMKVGGRQTYFCPREQVR